jgi:hypothetical protein
MNTGILDDLEDIPLLTTEQEHVADLQLRAENDEREARLWGSLLADKQFVQSRGIPVWWKDRKRGLIHCGGRIVTRAQFAAVVDRERRLLTNVDSATT